MDKRQYKRVMEQIQMSDACEQRILDAVHRQEMPKRKKTITLRKRAGIAVAAAACVQRSASFLWQPHRTPVCWRCCSRGQSR